MTTRSGVRTGARSAGVAKWLGTAIFMLICGAACGGRASSSGASSTHGGAASNSAGGSSADNDGGSAGQTKTGGAANDAGRASDASDGEAGSAGSDVGTTDPAGMLVLERQIDWLYVDDARFYWLADPDKFESREKRDCASTVVSYGPDVSFPILAPSHVYWGNVPPFLTCPAAGCQGAPSQLVLPDQAKMLAADGDYLYFSTPSGIYRCLFSGCANPPQLVGADETPPSSLIIRGSNAYWVNQTGIRRGPKDGTSAPINIAPSAAVHDALATDDHAIYWIDSAEARVLSCPLDGCGGTAPNPVVNSDTLKGQLHVDASGLYWKEEDAAVHFCVSTSCASSSVLTTPDVRTFAIDDRFVYWNVSNATLANNVRRVLKPTP